MVGTFKTEERNPIKLQILIKIRKEKMSFAHMASSLSLDYKSVIMDFSDMGLHYSLTSERAQKYLKFLSMHAVAIINRYSHYLTPPTNGRTHP